MPVQPATAPQVVFEQAAPCADAAAAEELLRELVAYEEAPRKFWSVRVRVVREARTMRAEAEIVDEIDTSIARRVVVSHGAACVPLVRAVGVWAELVLDDERSRAAREASREAEASAEGGAGPGARPAARARDEDEGEEGAAKDATGRGESAAAIAASSGSGAETHARPRPRPRDVEDSLTPEVGLATTFALGTRGDASLGGGLFALIGAGRGWFVRPFIGAGGALPPLVAGAPGSWGAVRLDGCGRAVGAIRERARGFQLDLCVGFEMGIRGPGAVEASAAPSGRARESTLFIVGGPSLGLRYDAGRGPVLEARVVSDVDVAAFLPEDARDVRPSAFVARFELGASFHL